MNNICYIDKSLDWQFQDVIKRFKRWVCLNRYINEIELMISQDNTVYCNVVFVMLWNYEENDLYRLKHLKRKFNEIKVIVVNPNDYPIRRAMRMGAYAVLNSNDSLDELEEIMLSIL